MMIRRYYVSKKIFKIYISIDNENIRKEVKGQDTPTRENCRW